MDNTAAGSIVGAFSNLNAGGTFDAGDGLTFSVSGGAGSYGNDLILTVATVAVPEPVTGVLVVMACLSLALLKRRKLVAA
jgi:hypothetical protein